MSTTSLKNGSDPYLKALQYTVFTCLILYFGRNFFILLSFAVLVSFVLYPICAWLEKRRVPRMLAILLSLILLLIPVLGLMFLFANQLVLVEKEWINIQTKLAELVSQFSQSIFEEYAVSKERQLEWLTQTINQSGSEFLTYVMRLMYSSSFILTMLILVPVFSALILYYRHMLVAVSFLLLPDEKEEDIKGILSMAVKSYYNFIKGMTIVYTAVGVLNSLGLLLLGVPNAFFFGFTAAILTFIPYVGIMVGAILPMAVSWITFNSGWYPIGVVLVFSLVQYLEANIIFPLAVSNRLKINALATLTVIIVGGLLWGLAGMILFVPFLGILKLIADQHPKMKTLSLLLGTDASSSTKNQN